MDKHEMRIAHRKVAMQKSRRGRWVVGFGMVVFALVCAIVGSWWSRHAQPVAVVGHKSEATTFETLSKLLATPADKLGQLDIAVFNLLCAQGLPGAETLDAAQHLAVLDSWAQRVKTETERHLYRFRANPTEYENSEAYFRMLIMSVVLYEDFGIRYNPNRIALPSDLTVNDHFFADSQDIFLHGLLGSRRMGTCSSMPVLYAAIGRRLGYPLKLVTTKAHLFLRWEDGKERFDLEATGRGMNRYDDEHFKLWPFPVSDEEIRTEGYLKSLTAAEELAVFLSLRANCLKEAGQLPEAATCYSQAARLAPESRSYPLLLADAQRVRETYSPPAGGLASGNYVPEPNPPQNLKPK